MTIRRHSRSGALRRRSWLLAALALLAACSREEAGKGAAPHPDYETLELRYQGNNGTVSPAELAEDLGYLAPLRLSFVGSTISGPVSVQAVVTGDTDFGGAFNGAIIKLLAAKAPIVAVVGYYGVDDKRQSNFFVLEDSPIRQPRDLLVERQGVAGGVTSPGHRPHRGAVLAAADPRGVGLKEHLDGAEVQASPPPSSLAPVIPRRPATTPPASARRPAGGPHRGHHDALVLVELDALDDDLLDPQKGAP